jgi:hypothetical protein
MSIVSVTSVEKRSLDPLISVPPPKYVVGFTKGERVRECFLVGERKPDFLVDGESIAAERAVVVFCMFDGVKKFDFSRFPCEGERCGEEISCIGNDVAGLKRKKRRI